MEYNKQDIIACLNLAAGAVDGRLVYYVDKEGIKILHSELAAVYELTLFENCPTQSSLPFSKQSSGIPRSAISRTKFSKPCTV